MMDVFWRRFLALVSRRVDTGTVLEGRRDLISSGTSMRAALPAVLAPSGLKFAVDNNGSYEGLLSCRLRILLSLRFITFEYHFYLYSSRLIAPLKASAPSTSVSGPQPKNPGPPAENVQKASNHHQER